MTVSSLMCCQEDVGELYSNKMVIINGGFQRGKLIVN